MDRTASNAAKPQRKPSKLVRAITNPSFSAIVPKYKEPDANSKRLENSKFARAIGGAKLDYGIGEPDKPKGLPDADLPLFSVALDQSIEDKLPRGYNIRSLQRDDWDHGYTKIKAVAGNISLAAWDERCEYLRSRDDTYCILVITDAEGMVCCTGTLMVERKFAHNVSLVGHIEDLAVGDGQSGKNLGLRMLEALDKVSYNRGCYKTIVCTQQSNERFHNQKGKLLRS